MNKLPIIFKREKDIFYLFCFLNLAGYGSKNNIKEIYPLRKDIFGKLKNKIDISNYKLFERQVFKKHQGQFIQWLLQKKYNIGHLSDFYSKKEIYFFNKFDKYFQEFITKEKKNLLELKFKDIYLAEEKENNKRIIAELNDLIEKLNLDFNLLNLNKIVIMPNFLDIYEYGYGFKIKKTSFIVYGPLKNNKDLRLIKHEFLHPVVNSIILNNKLFFQKLKSLKKNKLNRALKKIGYSTWPVFMEECLVRALDIRMHNFESFDKEAILEQEKEKGFKGIKKMYSLLKENCRKNEAIDILNDILNNIQEYVDN